MSALFAWVVAATALLSPTRAHDDLAEAIANQAEAEAPLFAGDSDRRRTTALLVAIAFRESSLRADAVGDMVGGKPTSFCAFQLHLPGGAKTAEGWTGAEVAEDPAKCVTAAMRLLRASMRACPTAPLAWYAAGPTGCESVRAQRISRDRISLAQRLIRDVRIVVAGFPAPNQNRRPASMQPPAIEPSPARPRRFCGGA